MPKNKKIISIVLICLVFLGIFFLFLRIKPNPTGKTYEVSYADEIPGQITVYDFMSKLKDEGKITFTEKNYIGMGKFIISINGIKNSGEQNWIYYVNGKKAQVGVSNYKINQGDIISWKYEKNY